MKRKEVEDVMGGKDAWANVDKTNGRSGSFLVHFYSSWSSNLSMLVFSVAGDYFQEELIGNYATQ